MEMGGHMKYAVNEEGVATLRAMAQRITESAGKVVTAADAMEVAFDENAQGLGPHADSIRQMLEQIAQEEKEMEEPVEELSEIITDLADSYQDIMGNDRYQGGHSGAGGSSSGGGGNAAVGRSGGGYVSPYVKTTEDTMVTFTNPENGCQEKAQIHRTVYENSNIDPDMVIPAGTKFANGHLVQKDTTNMELMENGGAPFVLVKDDSGNVTLVPVELHHLDGRETISGAEYFTGDRRDGSMVEIPCTVHGEYSGILHIGGHSSFRVDAEGKKTRDAAKYEAYRKKHWKERAQRFREVKEAKG